MDKDYSKYSIDDFLDDETFRAWVMTGKQSQDSFWMNYIKTHPDQHNDIQNAIRILEHLKFEQLPVQPQTQQGIWNKIEQRVQISKSNSQEDSDAKIFTYVKRFASVAAAVVLCWFAWNSFYADSGLYQTELAQQISIDLPDQSKAQLNAQSKIQIDKSNFSENRLVKLSGEAFFEVTKGSRFIVETELGSVKVLGTSFNVFTRNGKMEVKCFTGKVAVTFKGRSEEYILLPGDKINNTDQAVSSGFFKPTETKTWKEGYFYFENAPLVDVLDELKRQYGLNNIQTTTEIKTKLYTGYFTKGNLEQALHSICLPLQLNGTVINKDLTIQDIK